jgi:hypothetical protein
MGRCAAGARAKPAKAGGAGPVRISVGGPLWRQRHLATVPQYWDRCDRRLAIWPMRVSGRPFSKDRHPPGSNQPAQPVPKDGE